MERDDPLRVLIVGAGIGGLTAAAALRGGGHQVRVLERAPALTAVGGYLGVQSNSVLALRRLGIDEPVVAAGEQVERFEMRTWAGGRLAWWSPGQVGRQLSAPNVTVPRHLLLSTLARAANDVDLRLGQTVVDLREEPEQVVVELATGERCRADLVVAADGLRSTVRSRLGLPGDVHYAGYTAWRARVDSRPPHLAPGVAVHYLSHRRTFGCWPVPGGTYWVATSRQPAPPDGADPARLADGRPLAEGFADAPPAVRRLLADTATEDLLCTPIQVLRGATSWHSRRVVLLGDAVHAMEPTTGQGAAQAMLDALALATALAGLTAASPAGQLHEALARYTLTRRGPVTAIAREASGVGRMHHIGGPTRRLVRDAVLRATPHRIWQRRAALRLTDARVLSLDAAGLDATGPGLDGAGLDATRGADR